MKHTCYNEQRQRGYLEMTPEYHYVTIHHPRYHMPYHWHLEYELIRVLHGEIAFSLNEQTIPVAAGESLFVADGVVHGCTTQTGDCVYECVVFDLRASNDICRNKIQEILEHKIILASHFTDAHHPTLQAVDALFRAVKEMPAGYEFMAQGAIYQFFGSLLAASLYAPQSLTPAAGGSRRHINQLKKAFHLIETSYAEPLTLQQLADAADLSAKYFCKFFKDMTQRTPIDYLNYYRIESACDKLVSEDKSALEIAYDCGFNDFSYFIKTFRKYKQTTPAKFIQAYKQANIPPAAQP